MGRTNIHSRIEVELFPLGETGIMIQFGTEIALGTHRKVMAMLEWLDANPFDGMIECVPAYLSVSVFYHPFQVLCSSASDMTAYQLVKQYIEHGLDNIEINEKTTGRTIEVPVCYGGELGPDLQQVAMHTGLAPVEIIRIHSETEYLVYMIGFAPGFPYLGGMDPRIAAPRRETPRTTIPKGSVGIAGMQTGIYPISTPGGWQLIGRTPLALFQPSENPPSLLLAGDTVRFCPISYEEYISFGGNSR